MRLPFRQHDDAEYAPAELYCLEASVAAIANPVVEPVNRRLVHVAAPEKAAGDAEEPIVVVGQA